MDVVLYSNDTRMGCLVFFEKKDKCEVVIRFYIIFLIVAILSGVGYGIYYYYNDTQTRLKTFKRKQKLETVNKQITVEFEQYRSNVEEEIKKFKEELEKQTRT